MWTRLDTNGLSTIIDVLKKCDMDHIIRCETPADTNWVNIFKRINNIVCNNEWFINVLDKSSLKDYAYFKNVIHLEEYLLDKTDFYGCSLKFKARSNTLPLQYRIRNWSLNNNGKCMLCNDDSVEDLRHFLFSCRPLNEIRVDEYVKLECNLCNNGFSDIWVHFITGNIDLKLYIMLGCPAHLITTSFRTKTDTHDAYNILDKFCKSYLKRAWATRCDILNSK